MATGGFITDLRQKFRQGDIVTRLIFLNVGAFLLVSLHWLELPAWVSAFVRQPWSLITYMFMHAGLLHLLFNMLWLYWFGRLFLNIFSSKHLRGLYVLGGICGGLLYMIAYNVFPYFEDAVFGSYLLGASASVLAIVIATAVREPDYQVQLLFIGGVRLKYMALFMIVLDLMFLTAENAGGHIAHLGGALAGWWFASGLQRGHDATRWINSLTDEEKKSLFDASKK